MSTNDRSDAPRATVLIVEDERDLADLYAEWLDAGYETRTVYTAAEATEAVDDAVDVVLLDRRLPDGSGDEVLDAIREDGIDARVVMVTAVEPDFDIVEMGFDAYLTKPVSSDELDEAIEGMLVRRDYDERVREYLSLLSKRTALEDGKTEAELVESEEYADLLERSEAVREEIDDLIAEFDYDDFRAAFLTLDADGGDAPDW